MGRKRIKLADAVRKAAKNYDGLRRTLCRAAKIDEAQFSHFMADSRGLSVAALERLAEVLNLELVTRPKRRRKGKT